MSKCASNVRSSLKTKQPFWFEADQNANKKGLHHAVYFVNGDQYIGDWNKNVKNGRGTMYFTSKGLMYEGDWKDNMKSGFGVLSVRKCTIGGGGKLRGVKEDSYEKIYSGGWKNNMRHGFGENWYSSTEWYEGEWYEGKRSGWGRMFFDDGTIFEGQWEHDTMSGDGILRCKSGNRYEGAWKNGMRNGEGKYYYIDKGQMLSGIWVDNIPKCGQMQDLNRDKASNPTEFPIPISELENYYKVTKEAREYFLSQIP